MSGIVRFGAVCKPDTPAAHRHDAPGRARYSYNQLKCAKGGGVPGSGCRGRSPACFGPRHQASGQASSTIGVMEASLTPTLQPAQRLHQLESGTTTEAALAFFNSLPAVEVATMIGSWRARRRNRPSDRWPARTGRLARQAIYRAGWCPPVGIRTDERSAYSA